MGKGEEKLRMLLSKLNRNVQPGGGGIYNPSTPKEETGESGVQDQPELYNNFKVDLGYRAS